MIALISDIHGNYEALKSVLKEIDSIGINEIYCLGDVAGYYSQINECCEELRTRNVKCIMGNHDWYLISGSLCDRSKSVNDCIKYQKKIITKENFNWISSFYITMREKGINMVHGGWNNPLDEYLNLSEFNYFDRIEGSIFSSGHTHIQKVISYKGKTYCNPGSVGQPRDGDSRAAFATFDGNKFELRRVDYDYEKVGALMAVAGFDSHYFGCLRDGARHLHR